MPRLSSAVAALAILVAACSRAGAPEDLELDSPPAAAPTEAPPATDAPPPSGDAPPAAKDAEWQRLANETHTFVVKTLLTPVGSYRTTPGADRTDEWHCASQLAADVSMLALGDASYQPYVDRTSAFMDALWDRTSPAGGYFATASASGASVDRTTKYVDDNALAGVTWLDAWRSSDPSRKDGYLASARAVANFLMHANLWDATYGGGFWWSTDKPDKPTQSNGLALRLFARLAQIDGQTYYRDWANDVLAWLDGTMFDAASGLYSWKREASGRNDAKFGYDQAILIDAHLDLYAATGDAAHLAKAQKIAEAMHRVLWDGGYVISTEDRRLSPVYSAWVSVTLVRLFEVDGDRKWLDRAAANLQTLDAKLRDPATHAYYATSRPDGSERSDVVQEVDQAWMQRAQAALARHP